MTLFYNTNFDFMGWRKVAIAASVAAILIGLTSLFIKGGPAYSVDFLVGILIGTYSSIFIASPAVVDWYSKGRKKKEEKHLMRMD